MWLEATRLVTTALDLIVLCTWATSEYFVMYQTLYSFSFMEIDLIAFYV